VRVPSEAIIVGSARPVLLSLDDIYIGYLSTMVEVPGEDWSELRKRFMEKVEFDRFSFRRVCLQALLEATNSPVGCFGYDLAVILRRTIGEENPEDIIVQNGEDPCDAYHNCAARIVNKRMGQLGFSITKVLNEIRAEACVECRLKVSCVLSGVRNS
jgi:hypothetical protein